MSQALSKSRVAVSSLFFLYGVGFASWASRIPDIRQLFSLSDPELGSILLWLPAGSFLSLLAAGVILVRYSSSRTAKAAVFLYSVSLTCVGILSSKVILALSLFLFGLFGNLLNIAINTQAIGLEKRYNRSLMASFHALFSIGFVVGAAIGGLFSRARIHPLVQFGAVAIASCIVMMLARTSLITDDERSNTPRFVLGIRNTSLLMLGLMVFCGLLAEGAMIDWSAIYYRRFVSSSIQVSAAAFTTFGFAMMIGRLVGDWIVNRLGPYKTQFANGIVLSLAMLLSLLVHKPGWTLVGYAIVGLSIANIVPISYSLAGQSPLPASIALAGIATIGFFGFLLGPALIGVISGWLSLRVSLGVIVILGITVSTLAAALKRRTTLPDARWELQPYCGELGTASESSRRQSAAFSRT